MLYINKKLVTFMSQLPVVMRGPNGTYPLQLKRTIKFSLLNFQKSLNHNSSNPEN